MMRPNTYIHFLVQASVARDRTPCKTKNVMACQKPIKVLADWYWQSEIEQIG